MTPPHNRTGIRNPGHDAQGTEPFLLLFKRSLDSLMEKDLPPGIGVSFP